MSTVKQTEYWKNIIRDVEVNVKRKTRVNRHQNCDLSVTLPDALKRRVKKIIPYEFDEYDRNVYIDELSIDAPQNFTTDDGSDDSELKAKEKAKLENVFIESECSEIERMETEFPKFEMKLDMPMLHEEKEKKPVANWFSTYICQQRKERVQWDSKIYQMERNIQEMTLDEQAEQLMDASAERFSEWLNSLGSNRESDISKEQLKALFSIEGDRKLLSSIQTEPKEVKAIAKAVADKWNLPEMAIELKYENYIKFRLMNVPKKVNYVAFGRCVPYRDRPWLPSDKDRLITTVFPEELLSGEKLFKGIGHLRSTRALVDFYRARPQIEKPRYLVKSGMFKQKQKTTAKQEIPLYELLKLKY